jgi:hypothetical protein
LIAFPADTPDAHPAWAISVNTEGFVFFSDLEHIWAIDPSGRTTIYLPNVHTHLMSLDDNDHLVGEHSWYDQNAETFKTSFWRAKGAGVRQEISDFEASRVIGITLGSETTIWPESNLHLKQVMFYRTQEDAERQLLYQHPMGAIDGPLDTARFGVFGDWTRLQDGATAVTSGGQLRLIKTDQSVTTLLGEAQGFEYHDEEFSRLLGVDSDAAGNLYVADYVERVFYRLSLSGQLNTIAESGRLWAPGGVKVKGDAIYLLEFSRVPLSGNVRVRKLDQNGEITIIGEND